MEDVVKYQASSTDYLEVSGIIQEFLDGTGNRWAWDDFISKRRFKDEYLDEIRLQCDLMSMRHPSAKLGQYCNDDGLFLLQDMADDLRNRAAQLDKATHRGL